MSAKKTSVTAFVSRLPFAAAKRVIAAGCTVRQSARRLVAGSLALAVTLTSAPPAALAQGRVAVVRDAEIETLLRDYATPILKAAGLSQRAIGVVLVNDQSFNAFVDGRRIFVNTGALMQSEVPNEIIGVLAHEAGHLAGNHQQRLREQMAAARTLALVGSLLGVGAIAAGSISGSRDGARAGSVVASAAPGLAMRSLLSYRRSEEMNADQAAAKYLNATGQSMQGMLTTFARFSQGLALSGVRVDPYLQSHPLPRERISLLEELARKSSHFAAADPAPLVERHQLMRAKIAAYTGGPGMVQRLFNRDRSSLAARYGDAIATDLGGNSASALKKMDALIKERPKNAYFHEFRGEILLKLGKADDAVKAFSSALKLDRSKSPLIRARLGFALTTTGNPKNAGRAIEELRAAIQSDPDNLNAYLHLSKAYGLNGDIANAELILAEGNFRAGNTRDAKVFAARASQKFPKGSPGALRANDILQLGN